MTDFFFRFDTKDQAEDTIASAMISAGYSKQLLGMEGRGSCALANFSIIHFPAVREVTGMSEDGMVEASEVAGHFVFVRVEGFLSALVAQIASGNQNLDEDGGPKPWPSSYTPWPGLG